MDDGLVHGVAFGEAQGSACQSAQTVAKGGIEPLHMVGLSPIRTAEVSIRIEHFGIGWPQVTDTAALLVALAQVAAQIGCGDVAAVSQCIGHDLPGASAQGQPQPAFVGLTAYITPQLIKLKDVVRLALSDRVIKGLWDFFLASLTGYSVTPQTVVAWHAGCRAQGRCR